MAELLCLVDAGASGRLERAARKCFEPTGVDVLVERRRAERRRGDRRASSLGRDTERRLVRNPAGIRVGDRRAELVPARRVQLPRKLRGHEAELRIVERVPRTAQQLEDREATRLVIRAQLGDDTAFGSLYELYFDKVYSYLHVALKDRHEAEDLAQDVFMRVMCCLPKIEVRPGKPFRVLLFRITRNRSIDHMRKHGIVAAEPPERMLRRCELSELGHADELASRLSDGELAIFIRRLPDTQRQAIAMRYMLDFDAEEIAEVMQTTPQAVRNLQHRGLRFLRERLIETEQQPRRVTRAAMRIRFRGGPVLTGRRLALAPPFGARLATARQRGW